MPYYLHFTDGEAEAQRGGGLLAIAGLVGGAGLSLGVLQDGSLASPEPQFFSVMWPR